MGGRVGRGVLCVASQYCFVGWRVG